MQRTNQAKASTKLVRSYDSKGKHQGTTKGSKSVVTVAKPLVVERITSTRAGSRARKVYSYSVTDGGITKEFTSRVAAEAHAGGIYAKAKAKANLKQHGDHENDRTEHRHENRTRKRER